MKQFIALVILACALCTVQGRQLKQQTLAQALQAAQGTRTSTLIAAVQVRAELCSAVCQGADASSFTGRSCSNSSGVER